MGLSPLKLNPRTYIYLLQMTIVNVYVSCLTDPLVYITLACRRSDLKSSPTKMTGTADTNPKTRGRVFQVADMTADLDAAAKEKSAAASRVTFACEGKDTAKDEEISKKESEDGDIEVVIIEKGDEDIAQIESQNDNPESASFTCTEL